ncbi:glycosyltransferase family 4 protein [Thermoleptolyngbya sp. C42_A2020_037]|uniref:glycosyltransferase family 4 protein n=1 Tax=Thermoleptolyngbya sp. C42_A2020_037 TaxID=2747799 RepID=UPI0019FBDE68|nr:glycosyltransferase [Thermoleptolyngbya sp. C42_A2020_037]MBF2085622.1 glycosyltransferase [Thermoleptolyngbya sp. C42_A2020_037]
MNIVQLNTWDIDGGAARAAYRLHKGLLLEGHQDTLICLAKSSEDDAVLEIAAEPIDHQPNSLSSDLIQRYGINEGRTPLSNTLFSFPYPGWDVSGLPIVQSADVINLHWVARFQSLVTLKKLFDLGKPVVWTLHDMWAFSGGCHYSAGCSNYETDCGNCPQLVPDLYGLATAALQDKLEFFAEANLTIVTPSRWLADCARRSRLFRDLRIEVIPNSLETDVFFPVEKAIAKQKLDIAPETVTLLFGAFTTEEHRKGFAHLLKATQQCLANPEFRDLAENQRLQLLCFGDPDSSLESLPIPVQAYGKVASDDMLRVLYAAADVFVLPSLEDNLPNTMLEAMSCGTPVLAFNVGGIPDVVVPGKTGWLVPEKDIDQLAEALLQIALHPETARSMGADCRHLMEDQFSLLVQATRYLALYQDLLGHEFQQPSAPDLLSAADLAFASAETSLGFHSRPVLDAIARPILETQLQQTTAELMAANTQIQQQQAQIQQQQAHFQQELQQQQEKLYETQLYLNQIQSYAKTLEVQTLQLRSQSEQLQSQLSERQSRIDQLRADKKKLGDRLQKAKLKISNLQQQVEAMQSSKFWKLRTAWVSLKNRLRLNS